MSAVQIDPERVLQVRREQAPSVPAEMPRFSIQLRALGLWRQELGALADFPLCTRSESNMDRARNLTTVRERLSPDIYRPNHPAD
ncbi:hypothetical protein ACFWF7_21260 [Nocardia sp. NPDC060256]|uniref:hypothetical protein n=1 Tax=unclassified Nocardia TaxID=2637762 RepID=UPI00366228A3